MTNNSESVCIVTGNTEQGDVLREMVQTTDLYSCTVVSSLSCLDSLGGNHSIAVILLDRSSEIGNPNAHSELLEHYPVATFGKAETASESLDYIESRARFQLRHPVEINDLRRLFNQLTSPRHVERPTDALRPLHLYRGLVGNSNVVQKLKSVIERVAPTSANVLVLGETGTGKEVVARNIHYQSSNNGGSFVPVNCSAIPADLLESELFGHRKGAFTGAISDRVGRFELASGGTLFLDEIGDMPLVLQVKLLRVLEDRMIYPLGGDSPVPMTARVVAATHRDLEQLVERDTFREDLYYRLNVVPIEVPPLRERKEDIPHLAYELSCRIRQEQNVAVEFSDAAIEKMQQYDWPGNIRELANLVERLTVLHPDGSVEVEDLPLEFHGSSVVNSSSAQMVLPQPGLTGGFDLKEYLQMTEAELIRQALDHAGGVVSRAAELLHVRRTTLTEKVKRLGLSDKVKLTA